MHTINWKEQWGLASHEETLTLDFHDLGGEHPLELFPGPGFGDASHPTTQLMLKHMGPYVRGREVLDIGCGSGILSLAALSFGAKSAYGVDIDPLAIDHARKNASLNPWARGVCFSEDYPSLDSPIVLINMISSEQREAIKSFKLSGMQPSVWVISGLLEEEPIPSHFPKLPSLTSVQDGWKSLIIL